MEQIIEAGGKGIQVKDSDAAETICCLQAVVLLEKLLGEKIPGCRFEAGTLTT